jgi:hypothetical protein
MINRTIDQEIEHEQKNDEFLSQYYDIHNKSISLPDNGQPNAVKFIQAVRIDLIIKCREAFNLSKNIDPRITHLDWLDETSSQLNDLANQGSLDKAIDFYNNKLINLKSELTETAKESNLGFIGAVIAAITAVLPSLLSLLASNLVKWVNELGLLK